MCNICDHRENERITVYTHCAYHTHATINGREPPFLHLLSYEPHNEGMAHSEKLIVIMRALELIVIMRAL